MAVGVCSARFGPQELRGPDRTYVRELSDRTDRTCDFYGPDGPDLRFLRTGRTGLAILTDRTDRTCDFYGPGGPGSRCSSAFLDPQQALYDTYKLHPSETGAKAMDLDGPDGPDPAPGRTGRTGPRTWTDRTDRTSPLDGPDGPDPAPARTGRTGPPPGGGRTGPQVRIGH